MIYIILALFAVWGGMVGFNMWGTRSVARGVIDGGLADCPTSPNCVCSQASRAEQRIEPIPFGGSSSAALEAVQTALEAIPRTRIVTQEGNYMHAVSSTLLLRYSDDLEVFIDEAAKLIHLRAASRLGYSDMGVNRRRTQQLRERIQSQMGLLDEQR